MLSRSLGLSCLVVAVLACGPHKEIADDFSQKTGDVTDSDADNDVPTDDDADVDEVTDEAAPSDVDQPYEDLGDTDLGDPDLGDGDTETGDTGLGDQDSPLENPDFVPVASGLPVLTITTEDAAPIVSKDDYLNGTLAIASDTPSEVFNGTMRVKGRGNYTWTLPKKPYRIKLDSKKGLLGMAPAKDWVLLANYADRSLLRTTLAFELAQRMDMAFAPVARHVELFVNGRYAGVYQLTVQIEVHESRVNITEMDEEDIEGQALTGGYFLEIDFRRDADFCFTTGDAIDFCIKSPEDITPEQLSYIQSYIQGTEDAIHSESFNEPVVGYDSFIDTSTFIDWYLHNELFKNKDAAFLTSVFLYKERDQKLSLGPVWDFDIAAGNVGYDDLDLPTGWCVRYAPWFERLFEDPAFSQAVRDRWEELKTNEIDTLVDIVDEQYLALKAGADNNFKRWLILNVDVGASAIITGRYERELVYLKGWLLQRIAWMDENL